MSTYVFINIPKVSYTILEVIIMHIATLDSKKVGQTVSYFRNQKGVSQEVLSGLADIGRSHLSAIERGERKPTLETLYRICNALEIKMSVFVLKLEELL